MGQKLHNKNRKYLGVVCIICSGFFFAAMTAFVKLAGELPTFEKAFFRNFVAAVMMLVIILKKKEGFRPKKGNLKYLFARSICGTIGLVCNFYAVDHLVLSDANMLNKMSPFFAILFCFILLKEKLNLVQGLAVLIAFGGSLLIMKPSGDFALFFPSLIGLIGGLGAGMAYAFVRVLGVHKERGDLIVFFFSAFSCIVLLPLVIWQFEPMTVRQLIILLLAGAAACGGQICITKAYTFAPAREISVYDYTQVIFSSVFGFFLFGQVPDGYSILGYVIIIGMAVLMFLYNNDLLPHRKKEQAHESEE